MKNYYTFIVLIIILFFLLPVCITAQDKWQVQNPLPTESFLLIVESVTDNKILAGGLGGTLLRTNDSGETWTVQKFKDLVNIRSISFIDSLNGWLIDGEHIYHTIDGSESWNEVHVDADMSTYFFLDIICFENTIYLFLKPQTAVIWELINANSLVLKSADGGKTWEQLDLEIKGKMLCAFFLDENNGFLYSEETISIDEGFTSFYKTCDGGETWTKSRFPVGHHTLGMHFVNEDTGFVGQYRTTDGGETWENVFTDCLQWYENIEDIFFADLLCGWALSWFKILYTEDGGLSWKELNQYGSHRLTDINFSMNGTGWIVGWAGNIFRKGANNDIWEQLSEGTKNSLNDVFFIDENNGWCVGTSGCIIHTSNGGKTWEKQNSPVDSVLFKVKFLNNLEGWIAGYYAVLQTNDGGNKWEVINNLNKWFVDVDFFDDKNGLLIERFGNVYRTKNGGENWEILNDQPFPRLTSLAIVNKNEAWIGGWQGLGHTTDRGATIKWYDVPNLSLVRNIQFVDKNFGFITNDFAQFLMTSDGGWNWKEIPRGSGLETGPIQAFYMLDNNNGWIYWDYKGGLIKNVNVSQTISALEVDQYSVPAITKINFVNSNIGWAIGAGGTILKYTNSDSSASGVQRKKINIFPNPFSENGAYITFTLYQTQHINIKIYNSIGQLVQILYDGVLYEGDKTLFWLPGNIASGIYFISVQCNEFNQTQRCVYIH